MNIPYDQKADQQRTVNELLTYEYIVNMKVDPEKLLNIGHLEIQ